MRRTLAAVLALSTSTLALALPAQAQGTQPPAATETTPGATPQDSVPDEAPGQEVIVTGTRTANRTVADSPVPVDVISSESLSANGTGDTNKIINALVPSFNFPRPSIADGSDVIRPATLRGLSPDQTLVLVNGKRRHVSSLLNINGTVGRGSAAVDLNTIPAIAIDRVEVLRDGAASQYGSDAIAGVINVRLKTANHGGKATISYGEYRTKLDGVDEVTSLQTNGAGSVFLDPTDTRYLAANLGGKPSRHDGETWTTGINIGLPIGEGFLNLTAEARKRDAVNRAGYDLRPNYNIVGGVLDARERTFNRLNFQLGDPQTKDYSLILNGGLPVGDGWELYTFGSYAHRDGLSAANWRQQSTAANRNFATVTPATTLTAANFVPLTADGFLPFIGSKYVDFSIAGGIKGEAGPWNIDLSGVYGHNKIDYRTENSLNTSYGAASPTSFDSGGIRFGQFTGNLDVTREFEVGFAKPLTLAFGGEYRHENFSERAGQPESYNAGPFFRAPITNTTAANCTAQGGVYAGTTCSFPGRSAQFGAQGFPGIPNYAVIDKGRHSWAAYAELDSDITDSLTVTAAGRYEKYSDFGDTLNGKLAARFEIVPQFAVRGSISNGFRAPSLHQQYFSGFSTNVLNGVPVDIVTFPVTSPVSVALGATPLKPEKSVNASVGFTANPFRGFNLTADYFHIKIKDRIVLTENLGAAGSGTTAQNNAIAAILGANNLTGFGAARFFINGLDTTTKGVDVVATYRFGTEGFGNWSLSAAYNYTSNKIDRRLSNPGPLAAIPGLVLFGRIEGIRFEDGQPNDKIVLSADGSFGRGGVTLRTTRYGKVVAPGTAAPIADPTSLTLYGPDDIFLKRKWITDLEVRYEVVKDVTLAVGADNLFDVYPTRNPYGPRPAAVGGVYPVNQIYIPYSGFSPFGFNGRFLYGRITAAF